MLKRHIAEKMLKSLGLFLEEINVLIHLFLPHCFSENLPESILAEIVRPRLCWKKTTSDWTTFSLEILGPRYEPTDHIVVSSGSEVSFSRCFQSFRFCFSAQKETFLISAAKFDLNTTFTYQLLPRLSSPCEKRKETKWFKDLQQKAKTPVNERGQLKLYIGAWARSYSHYFQSPFKRGARIQSISSGRSPRPTVVLQLKAESADKVF